MRRSGQSGRTPWRDVLRKPSLKSCVVSVGVEIRRNRSSVSGASVVNVVAPSSVMIETPRLLIFALDCSACRQSGGALTAPVRCRYRPRHFENTAGARAILKGIDHLVIVVPDLDTAVASYRGLGFTVVPGGRHPTGPLNALIAFTAGAYLQLIAFSRPY